MISLAMIVKNEEKHLKKCLDSVIDLVDELVIVDTGSTDNTVKLVKDYPKANIYQFNWIDDFSAARNFAIVQCKGDYILMLDADEYVTYGCRRELEKIKNKHVIGQIRIKSHFTRDNQVFHTTSFISRFFPKELMFTGAIHEQINSILPRVKMELTVSHEGYFNTHKGERNIPLLIKELNKSPSDPYYLFQLGREYRLKNEFIQSFKILYKAYQLVKPSASFYEELVVELINSGKEYGNDFVLEIIRENEQYLKHLPDFHFTSGLYYLDYCLKHSENINKYISHIESSFLNCLAVKNGAQMEHIQGTSSFLAAFNLGLYYELTGNVKNAIFYYRMASEHAYYPAGNRLNNLYLT